MINDNYLYFAKRMFGEIYSSLTTVEWQFLSRTPQDKTFSQVMSDNKIDYKDVYAFLRATPKSRETRKSWKSSTAKLALLKFCGLHFLKSAYLLMKSAGSLPENGGYREIVSAWAMNADYIRRVHFEHYNVIDDEDYVPPDDD